MPSSVDNLASTRQAGDRNDTQHDWDKGLLEAESSMDGNGYLAARLPVLIRVADYGRLLSSTIRRGFPSCQTHCLSNVDEIGRKLYRTRAGKRLTSAIISKIHPESRSQWVVLETR